MGRIRIVAVIVVATASFAAFAGSAPAAMTTSLSGKTLKIFSDTPNEANDVSFLVNDTDGLVFVDSATPPVAGYCPVSGDEIVCGALFDGVKKFEVDLRGGGDSFTIFDPRLLELGVPLKLNTGPGDDEVSTLDSVQGTLGPGNDEALLGLASDRMNGGSGNDKIFGDIGDDTLIGGPGNDILGGGQSKPSSDPQGFGLSDGRDTFIGGGGNDTIKAKDFTKDRKIDCGGGRDKVKRDSFDPKPKSC